MIQFTQRERKLAIGLAVVVALWGLYAMAIQPMRDRIRTLQRVIPEQQAELKALETASAEYLSLQGEFEHLRAQMASQQEDFQPLPFLEALIERQKLGGHVVAMEQDVFQPQPDYSETRVGIELQDVSLAQLIELLAAIEQADAVIAVASLHIRRDRASEGLLDSTVSISCPRLQGQTPETRFAQQP